MFHAAAHKHVPLLEDQVAEAIRNNVFGTLAAARTAERYGADRFVLISTDKAVNPVSVMGATKRLCELVVQSLMKDSPTRFCAVRFGNVLGSNGSVTLVFLRQIRAGGPVTVTHPEMRRYFMLISEAVELVAQAATAAEREPSTCWTWATRSGSWTWPDQMIRLAGYRPEVDIPIQFTGLRPGERLDESLVDVSERVLPCETKGLFRVVSERSPGGRAPGTAALQAGARLRSKPHMSIEAILQAIACPERLLEHQSAVG